jgi:sec-independent protein translocase protein TatB
VLGLSFSEVVVIAMVALVAVGPQKLPGLLRTLGQWARKLRMMSSEMRAQSGIDDVLRAEGIQGGLQELRGLMRGGAANFYVPPAPRPAYVPPVEATPPPTAPAPEPVIEDPYADVELDVSREYPLEGPDAYGALADDLVDDGTVEAEPEAAADAPPDAEPFPVVNDAANDEPPPLALPLPSEPAAPIAAEHSTAPAATTPNER